MNEAERSSNYFSCLIRMQRVGDDGRTVWRCSLEFPGTGEVLSFPSLDALVTYLKTRTAPGDPGRRHLASTA